MHKNVFKSLWSKVVFAAAIIIPLASTLSCDIGLGEAVDVSAPTLTISYPPSGAVIRDSFVLAGECKDDVMITNVNVRVVNTSTGREVYKGTAAVAGTSWRIDLNNYDENAYAATNGWQYPDGTYEITAWANDNSGKTSGVSSRSVDVDNTAPFFIISKPGVTVANGVDPAAYGSNFTVTGTIADLHEISKMALDVYDGKTNVLLTSSTSSNLAENIYETSVATAGGTSVDFANTTRSASGSEPVAYQRYVHLYGTVENKTETKSYKCTVRLTDAAKEYKNPGDSGTGEGNTTSEVYLYDDVYSAYLSSSKGLGLSATNLMNISNGSVPNNDLAMATLKEKAVDTSDFDTVDNRLSFTLNPAANPTYVLSGLEIFNGKNDFTTNQLASSSNVTATVSAGLNNTGILPKTIHVWVKDMTSASDKAEPDPYTEDDAKKFIDALNRVVAEKRLKMEENNPAYDASYTNANFKTDVINALETPGQHDVWCVKDNTESGSSSGTLLTVPFGMSEAAGNFLKVNHKYIIALTGYDLDGLEFGQAKYYGFTATGTGKLPEIHVTSPSNLSLVKTSAKKTDDNDGLTFKGTAKNGDSQIDYIMATVTVTDESTNELKGEIKKKLEIGSGKGISETGTIGSYTWEFSPAECEGYDAVKCEKDKAYLYSVDFLVHETGNSQTTVNSTVHVDAIKPVVTITSITPVINDYAADGKSYVNGIIKVKGNVEETNLKSVKIEYIDKATSEVKKTVNLGKTFSFTDEYDTRDPSTGIVNNTDPSEAKEFIVRVTAEDSASKTEGKGNVGFTTSTDYNKTLGRPDGEDIIVDQVSDKPKIKPTNFEKVADYSNIEAGKNLFGISSNNKMKFNVEDDDGKVSDITAYVGSPVLKALPVSGGAVDVSSLGEGEHEVTIYAKDSSWISDADTPNSYIRENYKIAVSKGAPKISFTPDNNSYKKGAVITVNGKLTNSSVSKAKVTLTKADGTTKEEIEVPAHSDNKDGEATFTDTITVNSNEAKETVTVSYTLVDKFGQSESEKFSYVVDNQAPSISITAVTPTVEDKDNPALPYVNGNVSVTFNASDNYELTKVEYICYAAENDTTNISVNAVNGTVTGGTEVSALSVNNVFTDDSKFGKTFKVDTTKVATGKTRKSFAILLKATDSAQNVAYVLRNFIVDQETDKPVIKTMNFNKATAYATDDQAAAGKFFSTAEAAVSGDRNDIHCPEGQPPEKGSEVTGKKNNGNPVYEYIVINTTSGNLFSASNNNLMFSVTDDDMIDAVDIKFYAADKTTQVGDTISRHNIESTTYQGSVPVPESDGFYYVEITAIDKEEGKETAVKNVSDKIKFAVSSNAPSISVTSEGKRYFRSDADPKDIVNVKGTATSWDNYITLNRGSITSGHSGAFTDAFEALALAGTETEKTVNYTATNTVGQSSTAKLTYYIDDEDPKIDITAITPVVITGTSPSIVYNVNGNITVTGKSSDNNEIERVEYKVYKGSSATGTSVMSGVRYKTQDQSHINKGDFTAVSNVNGWEISIDTTKITEKDNTTKDNIFVVIEVTDVAGNTSRTTSSEFLKAQTGAQTNVCYYADQESDRPIINPSNFVALANGAKDISSGVDGNLFGVSSNNKLMGSISDDDGIRNAVCYYRIASSYEDVGETEEEKVGSATFSKSFSGPFSIISNGSSTSVNLSQILPSQEGKYEIYFEVEDTNYRNDSDTPYNKFKSNSYYVGVSKGAPTISMSAPENKGYTRSYKDSDENKAELNVVGLVGNYSHDTTTLIRNVIRTYGSDERDKEVGGKQITNSAGYSLTPNQSGDGQFTSTIQPLSRLNSGDSMDIEYTVTDIFGQSASAKITYIIDDTAPKIKDDIAFGQNGYSNLTDYNIHMAQGLYAAATWYKGKDISIEGYFYDKDSGITQVNYSLVPHYESGKPAPAPITGDIVATYILVDKDTNLGYYKFKGTISGYEKGASNKLQLWATDSCGNSSDKKTVIVRMDETSPEYKANFVSVDGGVTSSSATGTVTINGKQSVTLYGTLKDLQSGIGVLSSGNALDYTLGDNDLVCVTTFTTNEGELDSWSVAKGASYVAYSAIADKTRITGWKTEIAAAKATSGTLVAECTDVAGTKFQNPSVLMFTVDKEAPVVTIRSNTVGVNGSSESIEGSVTENFSLAGFDLYYAKGALPANKAKEIYDDTSKDLTTYGWTRFTATTETDIAKIYSWKIDGFNFNTASGAESAENNAGTGVVYVLPVAKDKAGNSSAYKIGGTEDNPTYSWNATKFEVDMNRDRPTVQVTNLTRNGSGESADPYTYILKYGTNAQISGTISDDDAETDSVVKVLLGSSKQIKSVVIPTNGNKYIATFTDNATAEFVYSKDGSKITWTNKDYGTTTLTGTDWTYTPADTKDGSKSVFFYVNDNKDGIFYTGNTSNGNLLKPYFQHKSESLENSGAALVYGSDCESPEVKSVEIVSYDNNGANAAAVSTDAIGTTLIVGGVNRRYIKFRILGKDANKIDGFTLEAAEANPEEGKTPHGVKYWIGNVPSDARKESEGYASSSNGSLVMDTNDNTESTWTTGLLDLNSNTLADKWLTGEISVTVNVYDKSGLKGNGSYSFNVDNSAPEIKNVTPLATDEKTGHFEVSGDASDMSTGRSGLASLTYYIPMVSETTKTDAELASLKKGTPAVSVWQDKSILKDKWSFSFNGENGANSCPAFDTYANATYGTVNANNIWTIPVYIKAVDVLGNVKISRHSITYNPDGDKPRTEFTYPTDAQYQKDEDEVSLGYVTLGSTIRVTGTVTIPNIESRAVSDGVYVQIAQEVIKSKKALTLFKAKRDLVIDEKNISSGTYLKASQVAKLGASDYETEAIDSGKNLTTAQAAVLVDGEDYVHAEDWAAAKTKCGTDYGYTIVTADGINTYDANKVNIAAFSSNASGFTSKENRNAWWGIPAQSTTSSWVIAINTRNELNPAANSGTTNNIAIRACSVNNAGKAGAWSNPYYIHIDDQAPVMTAELRQYNVPHSEATVSALNTPGKKIAYKDYEPGMYLKGEWYLYLEITDESGIVSDATGVVIADGKTFYKDAFTNEGTNAYRVWVPISGTEGNLLTYKISATDTDTGNPHTVTSTYTFHIDNTAPEFGSITTSVSGTANSIVPEQGNMSPYNLKDSNKAINLASSVIESGSGFERTVFYLVRKETGAAYSIKNTSVEVLMDPFSFDSDGNPVDLKVATSELEEVEVTQGDDAYSLWGDKKDGTQANNSVTYKNRFYCDVSTNTHIREGGLVYIGGLLRRITAITSSYVEFDTDTNGQETSAVFIYAQVVDNTTSEGGSPSSGYGFTFADTDDGDGMPEKVDPTSNGAKWNADFRSANLPDGPVTLVVMAFDKAGNVSCKEIDTMISNNAPRIAKVFLGTDIDGNSRYDENEFVEYNWSKNEFNQTVTANYAQKKTIKTADYVSGKFSEGKGNAFIIKKGLAVVPEIVGGNLNENGSIGMVYNRAATNDDAKSGTGEAIKVPATANTDYILPSSAALEETSNRFYGYTLSNEDISGLTDANLKSATESNVDGTNKKMSFTFWDETEEGIKGTSTQNAVLLVEDFTVDLIDGTAPKAVIHPFHWNSKSDNSIQKDSNGNLLGHIELEDDLVITKSDGTTVDTKLKTDYGADPKVSGKIVLTGYAYDETRLNKITIAETTGKYTLTNCYSEYKNTDGTVAWTSASGTGWRLTVTNKNAPSQSGHLAEWRLELDSEKVTGIACKDIKFTVTAEDATILDVKNKSTPGSTATKRNTVYATVTQYVLGQFYDTVALAVEGKTVSTTANGIDKAYEQGVADATQTNVYAYNYGDAGFYQMDVVPYVTKVTTSLSSKNSNNPSIAARTALGKYPVYVHKDSTTNANAPTTSSETVIIHGFNIAGAKYGSETTALAAHTYTQDEKDAGLEDSLHTVLNFDVGKLSSSGEVAFKVNGVETINNINNNDAKGDYIYPGTLGNTGSYEAYSNYYNRQPNNYNNNNLTDNLDIDVWQINKSACVPITGKVKEPVMKLLPTSTTGKLGFAFGDGTLYFDMYNESHSYHYSTASFDKMAGVSLAFDANNTAFATVNGGDTNSKEADKFVFMTSKWGVSFNGSGDNRHYSTYYGSNSLRLNAVGQKFSDTATDIDFDTERFRSVNLVTHAGADNKTDVYMAYYDRINDEVRLRFGAYDNTTTSKTSFGMFTSTETTNAPQKYAGNAQYEYIVSDPDRTGAASGEYVSIAVVPSTTAGGEKLVIVWYDAYNNKMLYSYNSKPTSINAGHYNGNTKSRTYNTDVTNWAANDKWTTAGWSAPETVFSNCGEYCQVTVDQNGGVHMAGYDFSSGTLKYAYKPSYSGSSTYKSIVDSNGNVGSNLTIDVALKSTGGTAMAVPYISYYSIGDQKPKHAYLVDGINKNATSVSNGSTSDYFTGAWEVSIVPTDSRIPAGRISSGILKTNAGVLTKPSGTVGKSYYSRTRNTYDSTNFGNVYANGTKNAVLAYERFVSSSSSYVETAQKK
ncbi:hypothetical protein [Treponema sp.]|uniref:hypothetical protein n=1 Tax=Treponema sp. TaxID=166 RepID=UPI00388E96E7